MDDLLQEFQEALANYEEGLITREELVLRVGELLETACDIGGITAL